MKKIHKNIKGVTLFSSAGIGETYLEEIGVDIVVANELIQERADLYRSLHPKSKMIQGDITNDDVFQEILESCGKIDLLIASPPCQGMSIAGKNRDVKSMLKDERNYLVNRVIEFIKVKKPDFVIIENVPAFLKILLPYKNKLTKIVDILSAYFGTEYNIESHIFDASEYGVPQFRKRAIIKMYKKGLSWGIPKKEKHITVREAIGDLPSLEAGKKSDLDWHFAREHSLNHILCMRHTPTGETALKNKIHFPVKSNGERVKGYNSSYRRILWDKPAPTITIRNDAISSQRNVHPGRLLPDGTYSDARVLTVLELMILNSLPKNWKIPQNTKENLIRQCIGESIPPLLLKKIVSLIGKK